MQGWAEDVAGMAYALRSLPEGAPCLPQVRASSGVPVPMGMGGLEWAWWERGGDGLVPSESGSSFLNVFFPDHKWNFNQSTPYSQCFSQLSLGHCGTI